MTETPDFAEELWKELEQLPCEPEGEASLIVDFERLKAAIAGVVRRAQARQFCEGQDKLTLRMRYDE